LLYQAIGIGKVGLFGVGRLLRKPGWALTRNIIHDSLTNSICTSDLPGITDWLHSELNRTVYLPVAAAPVSEGAESTRRIRRLKDR
jgi:hypothetical protein